jgi:hypothetical protein
MTITTGGGELARRLHATPGDAGRPIKGPAGMHEPDWVPLEQALPHADCVGFMWMGWAVRPDGGPIARYKHAVTRRYLNLDEDGNAYRYVAAPDPAWCGSYVRVPLDHAVETVFAGIARGAPT